VQLLRSLARPTTALMWQPQRRDRIDHLLQHLRVMHIGWRDARGERYPLAVNGDLAPGAQLAAIGRNTGPGKKRERLRIRACRWLYAGRV
jgi:hypothetical protein